MSKSLKICGMKYPSNINAVLAYQPDYMGFIFYPKSARYVEEGLYEHILSIDFGTTQKVGVFVNEEESVITDIHQKWKFDLLQLHGHESADYCKRLSALGAKIIKVFHIDADFDFGLLGEYESCADYFLFDTKTPKMGGSGKVFDWQILENYTSDKPLFLSGGIGVENIAEALKIAERYPIHALDINSRIEKKAALKDELLVKIIKRKIDIKQ
jgi:phosphoribosylanthranilate isomerase